MSKKICSAFILLLLLNITFCASAQTDSTYHSQRIRPKDKSFSTYITINGFTQNINIGLENTQYYLNNGFFNFIPIAALKYVRNQKHSFGLKFGINSRSQSYTRTDSVFFSNSAVTSKTARTIPVNSNFNGFYTDDVSENSQNMIFIPYYEYHFKGNKRWDYYLALEYLFNMTLTPKSKNQETLIYTNDNNDRIEYTYRTKKSTYLRNHGAIATFGVNFFIYRWLSVGTKISLSKQYTYSGADSYEEKLLVNGIDNTSSLNIPNNLQIKNYKTTTTGFLGNNNGGFISNFSLPFLINFYL